ncbi:MAG: TetR/AcrR family transcriptional regulator [Paracoccaceae bacterium]
MTRPAPDSPSHSRPRGRPRMVAPQQALDAAVKVFWSEGYDGASITRLSRRMRLPNASLYQAYGDKEGLFLASIARYAETRLAPLAQTLGPHGSLAADLRAFFDAATRLATADPATPGCLISCVLADAAGTNPRLRVELAARFTALETRLHQRLVAGQDELTSPTDPATLAVLLASVARGLMLRARAGADHATLQAVGRAAVDLLCPPDKPTTAR